MRGCRQSVIHASLLFSHSLRNMLWVCWDRKVRQHTASRIKGIKYYFWHLCFHSTFYKERKSFFTSSVDLYVNVFQI